MFSRKRSVEDFAAEIKAHLELEADELQDDGLNEDEAHRNARVAFGNAPAAEERFRPRNRVPWIDNLLRDISFSLRQIVRNPGFAIVVIVTLALGIGASTSIFSVADAVLLRPLPYPNPQQIVRVWEKMPNGHQPNLAESNFEDFLTQNHTFASLAAYDYGLASVSGGTEPARVNVSSVSSGFFPAFGVQPFRGRLFTADEQRPHGTPAIVVSYGYWQRYLGSTTELSKFHLDLEGGSYPVIGVMPPGFDFPSDVSAWISRELDPPSPSRTGHNWRGIGRLRDGATVAQAQANLGAIAHRIRNQYGTQVDLNDAVVVPLSDAVVGNVRTALVTLLCAVGLLLLVACANVAGLLVARTSARRKELAIRAALGAGRGRLIQQFLAESFALSLAAGLLGILMAAAGVRVLPVILPADLPRQQGISINPAVLLFALAASVVVAAALGLFAAWRAGGPDLQNALSAGSRGHTGPRSNQRLRSLLVIGEIATTLVILVGAGLLGRSFFQLISTSPGFRTESLVTMEFSLPVPLDWKVDDLATERQVHLLDQIVMRLRALPGATSVGLAGGLPVAQGDNLPDGGFLILNGHNPPADYDEFGKMAQNQAITGHALYAVTSQDYFSTLGIPLMAGRNFGDQDTINSTHVALISQALARQRWPGQNPIGQTIEFGNMDGNLKPLTIIGIVGDVRASGLDAPPASVIYVNYRQRGMQQNSTPTILMRTTAPNGQIDSAARVIFHNLAPDVPVKFSTYAMELGGWLAERRFLLLLVSLFALAALLLAAVGLYGVVAFFVTLRTQEIGVRMAIGAQRSDVLRLVLGEAARMASFGLIIGIVASLAITRLLSSLLFGVSATDPLTFVGVAALLSIVALAASWVPAYRAMRVDPVSALRYE
ncbi:MAG: ABC transporter permease [Terracidiphilus sp.]|jgi:predicted permease